VTCSRNETWCFYSENCGFFDKGELGIERLRTDFIAARAERDALTVACRAWEAEYDLARHELEDTRERMCHARTMQGEAELQRDVAVQRAERLRTIIDTAIEDYEGERNEEWQIIEAMQAALRGEGEK
jgi:hypothetical protein